MEDFKEKQIKDRSMNVREFEINNTLIVVKQIANSFFESNAIE